MKTEKFTLYDDQARSGSKKGDREAASGSSGIIWIIGIILSVVQIVGGILFFVFMVGMSSSSMTPVPMPAG